jgi:NAD+ kinase
MKIYLSVKPDDKSRSIANEIAVIAPTLGLKVTNEPRKADVIVSVGGDGTLSYTIKEHRSLGKPFIGVNGGRLGYHCRVRAENLNELSIITNSQPLPMPIIAVSTPEYSGIAISDVRVERLNHRALRLTLKDGEKTIAKEHVGDGILVTNAMGSTGYHLSCGGSPYPLTSSEIFLTPICPFPNDFYDSILQPVMINDVLGCTSKTEARLVLDDESRQIDGLTEVRIEVIPDAFRLFERKPDED